MLALREPRLSGLALAACLGPAVCAVVRADAAFTHPAWPGEIATFLLGLSIVALAIGLARSVGTSIRPGVALLTVLAFTVVLSVADGAGLVPAALTIEPVVSAIGALFAFIVAPLAVAHGLRNQPAWRGAAVVSAGVPVIFILSVVLDGPLLRGVGPLIDAIDGLSVLVWLELLGGILLYRSARKQEALGS